MYCKHLFLPKIAKIDDLNDLVLQSEINT